VKSPLCGSVPVGPSLLCSGWGSGLTLNPIYIYIYIYMYCSRGIFLSSCLSLALPLSQLELGFYTIWQSPILYGVWHTTGGSVGGFILRNGRAIVLQ